MTQARQPLPGAVRVGAVLALAALVAASWWLARDEASVGPHARRDAASGGHAVAVLRAPEISHAVESLASAQEPQMPQALDAPLGVAPADASFDVLVVDTEGRPVRGARVVVDGRPDLSAAADENGLARLPGDPFAHTAAAELAVTVTSLCYRPAHERLPRPDAEERSLLEPADDPAPRAPPRLVLHRCAVLQVAHAQGADRFLMCLLRSDGVLFDDGLPQGSVGAIGAQGFGTNYSRGPARDGPEPGGEKPRAHRSVNELLLRDGERTPADERLYDFAKDSTRLIVGLQPDRPVAVLLLDRYGVVVSEELVTLAAEEWRRLDMPVTRNPGDLKLSIKDPEGHPVSGPRILLTAEGSLFSRPASSLDVLNQRERGTFEGIYAKHVDLDVRDSGFIARQLEHVPLVAGSLELEIVMEPDPTAPSRQWPLR